MTTDVRSGHADLLASICSPCDVQALDDCQLGELADQLRRRIIETVTSTGGHLGSGLGMVELTVALHRVFSSPRDIILFDTGHQTYPHKLLTGRSEPFNTLRQPGGLSGYPSRTESDHDWVENSHASVCLAWADGISKALALQDCRDRRVVAIIGDGALTGGAAWEGMNNLGGASRPVIVVLNDNGRSYDPTAGGLAIYLEKLRRGTVAGPNLFELLGFSYVGPIDGHDIESTSAALRRAAELAGPVVVHVATVKGCGYPPAEADDEDRMHACGAVDLATGRPVAPSQTSWTDVFEDEIVRIADERPEIVGMTAAMRLPTGLGAISRRYPERVFDSGIAEQHLLASAAGLATAGLHPVVALYSTFLHRGFDQLLLDIGLHGLPVTVVLDRAGITGPDGPSHHGLWDLGLLASVPGLKIACPRDAVRLRQQLRQATAMPGPTAIRYPKGNPPEDVAAVDHFEGIDILYASPDRPRELLIVAVGAMAEVCVDAANQLDRANLGVTVADPQWVWPLSPALTDLASQHRAMVLIEDAMEDAGIGARIQSHLSRMNPLLHCWSFGLPSAFIMHGNRSDILRNNGLTGSGISASCKSLYEKISARSSSKARQSWQERDVQKPLRDSPFSGAGAEATVGRLGAGACFLGVPNV